MPRIKRTLEQILTKLREAEVALSNGHPVVQVCRTARITEQTSYRWRNEYGGLKIDQVKRLKELECENTRLKRAVADLTLYTLILKEAAEGSFEAQPCGGRPSRTAVPRWASPSVGPVGSRTSRGRHSAMRLNPPKMNHG